MLKTKKTHVINGFEVPVPESEELVYSRGYFSPYLSSERFYCESTWYSDGQDKLMLERGLVFLNSEDAAANGKAMLGIDPYPKKKQ